MFFYANLRGFPSTPERLISTNARRLKQTSGVPSTPERLISTNTRRLKTNLRGFSCNPGAFDQHKHPEVENKPPGFSCNPGAFDQHKHPEVKNKPPGFFFNPGAFDQHKRPDVKNKPPGFGFPSNSHILNSKLLLTYLNKSLFHRKTFPHLQYLLPVSF